MDRAPIDVPAEEAPGGSDWLHEITYDGYRMHARIDGDKIQLLTRTGLDWSHRYKRTIEALRSLRVSDSVEAVLRPRQVAGDLRRMA
jgi:ATP-dependent DNA ligase